MADRLRFPYVSVRNRIGEVSSKPLLPITLQHKGLEFASSGLLDSGADINVLPFHIGLALGAVWKEQNIRVPIAGSLADVEARGIVVEGTVADVWHGELAFAWASSRNVPLILGHVNFFESFDVCFYRTMMYFELTPTSNRIR